MIRTSRYGRLVSNVTPAEERRVDLSPSRGVYAGLRPDIIPDGFSPHLYNWAYDAARLTPRSGLSRSGGTIAGMQAMGIWRTSDAEGFEHAVAASELTFAVIGRSSETWSALTYQKPSTATNLPSGASVDYWQAASIYEPGADKRIVVFTNGVDIPKVVTLAASVTTYSDYTHIASHASWAKSVAAVDSRLVFFNLGDSAGNARWPQRLLWTPRGLPASMAVADGAGFVDLMDMRGVGVIVIPERDGAVLFSTQEIWKARRRIDDYAFDFYPITADRGTSYPRCVVSTPFGIVFLGDDLEVYAVVGDQVVPLGAPEQGAPSRIQTILQDETVDLQRAWAFYNPTAQRYELYYVASDTVDGFATRALWYHFPSFAWLPQRLGIELTAGAEITEGSDPGPTWDSTEATWDEMASSWDALATPGSDQYAYAFSSKGTSYRFDPLQTNDDGVAIDVVWRSPGLAQKQRDSHEQLYEVWVDAFRPSGGTMTFHVSENLGHTFLSSGYTLTLPSTEYAELFAPIHGQARAPVFEVRSTASAAPDVAGFRASLREKGRFGGAR